jgi:hypothetical protein
MKKANEFFFTTKIAGKPLEVRINPIFPIRKTVMVCDVIDRMEFPMLTGEMIHSFIVGEILMVSDEFYKLMVQRYANMN